MRILDQKTASPLLSAVKRQRESERSREPDTATRKPDIVPMVVMTVPSELQQ
ncbi:hypothetical protein [Bacterioplanes sanyensis]|uniref:hypothetical protein n=1 Tax=Bacterioplanes sanyensis TaxID=1249553 RepID=UPI0012FE1EDB|nr:hypothetical protein [Bacterioplanes sanyensis]